MAERVGIRSRVATASHAPARGPCPLAPPLRSGHPMKGEHPLQNPRFESHPLVMAERVGIRSRVATASHAPARGPCPLAPPLRSGHPMKGEHPLQNPRFESHPLVMAERVGFEPTVPLPAHVLSRHADSATLAPLRIAGITAKFAILAWGLWSNKTTRWGVRISLTRTSLPFLRTWRVCLLHSPHPGPLPQAGERESNDSGPQ